MPLPTLHNMTLRDGSTLSVRLGLTGLSEIKPILAELLAPSGFPDLDIIYRLLIQTGDDSSIQRHFFGFRRERLVGFLKYDASARVPYVCSLGYVFTVEDVRGLGIAGNLCRTAIADFAAHGGRAAFLSGSDTGEHVYKKVGFCSFNGHIMRWVVSGDEIDFDRFYFAGRPVVTIRNLTWADWAMAAVLYGQPTRIHIRDYNAQLYSGEGQEMVRFQSVIPPLMRAQEYGTGCTLVSEDTLGHLVGIATLHVLGEGRALVDFLVHKTAQASAITLLNKILYVAHQMDYSAVTFKIAKADEEKLRVCQVAGARVISESVENTGTNRMEPVVEMRGG